MTWNYSYDAKGQVSKALKALKKFTSNGEIAAGTQSRYAYDAIGNRTSLLEGGTNVDGDSLRETVYSPNDLNQYGTITRPQSFDVTGRRSSGAAITVNGQTGASAARSRDSRFLTLGTAELNLQFLQRS